MRNEHLWLVFFIFFNIYLISIPFDLILLIFFLSLLLAKFTIIFFSLKKLMNCSSYYLLKYFYQSYLEIIAGISELALSSTFFIIPYYIFYVFIVLFLYFLQIFFDHFMFYGPRRGYLLLFYLIFSSFFIDHFV